jgi:hypothetical protein
MRLVRMSQDMGMLCVVAIHLKGVSWNLFWCWAVAVFRDCRGEMIHHSAIAARQTAVWCVSFVCASSCKYTFEGRAVRCSGLQVKLQQQMHTSLQLKLGVCSLHNCKSGS